MRNQVTLAGCFPWTLSAISACLLPTSGSAHAPSAWLSLHHRLGSTAVNLATCFLYPFLCPRPALYGCNRSFPVSFLANTKLPLILITVNTLNILFMCPWLRQHGEYLTFSCVAHRTTTPSSRGDSDPYIGRPEDCCKKSQLQKYNYKNCSTGPSIKPAAKKIKQ